MPRAQHFVHHKNMEHVAPRALRPAPCISFHRSGKSKERKDKQFRLSFRSTLLVYSFVFTTGTLYPSSPPRLKISACTSENGVMVAVLPFCVLVIFPVVKSSFITEPDCNSSSLIMAGS